MEWLTAWEGTLASIAAALIASGVIWRYVVVPIYRLIKRGVMLRRNLADELAVIHAIVAKELTENGGESVKDQLNKLVKQGESQAAHLKTHDERLHVIGELFTAHLADSELKGHHLTRQLRERGIEIVDLAPRERWRWVNRRADEGDEG